MHRVPADQITARKTAIGNKAFREACEFVGVDPTRRQASKWLAGRGRWASYRNSKVAQPAPAN
jgi:hypothetical protein